MAKKKTNEEFVKEDLSFADEKWYEGFNHFKEYIEEFKTILVSQKYVCKDGYRLGFWISQNRINYLARNESQEYKMKKHLGTMKEYQIKALNDVGMIWDVLEYQWFQGLKYFDEYIKEFNTSYASKTVIYKDYKLGAWLSRQRLDYNNNELSQERIDLLNQRNMIWDCSINYNEMFENGFKYLEKYVKLYGNALVPEEFVIDDFTLGRWINSQRRKYKNYLVPGTNKSCGTLTNEQVKRLEALGMVWDVLENQWDIGYEKFKKYVKTNKHSVISVGCVFEDFPLGTWICHRRADYKKGKLSKEQIDSLEKLGMIWKANNKGSSSFPEYLIYCYFKSIYGENKVFYRDKSLGFEIDVYIPHLKIAIEYDGGRFHKNNKNDLSKNKKIEELEIFLYRFREFETNKLEDTKYLKNIYLEKFKEYDYLVEKLNNQFKLNVEIDIQKCFNEYVENTFNGLDSNWYDNYYLLKEYINNNGTKGINQSLVYKDKKIGCWLARQRTKNRKGTLSNKQIELLNSLKVLENKKDGL